MIPSIVAEAKLLKVISPKTSFINVLIKNMSTIITGKESIVARIVDRVAISNEEQISTFFTRLAEKP